MEKTSSETMTRPYSGALDEEKTAAVLQAARLNALELLATAELLFKSGRFGHAYFFSVIAIEEAGKLPIIKALFLKFVTAQKSWRGYRSHVAKTGTLSTAITSRIRAVFPQASFSFAQKIAKATPAPAEIESLKQKAIYSDCLETASGFSCHLPSQAAYKEIASLYLDKARAIISGLRDYSPEELKIWLRHAELAQEKGGNAAAMLPALYQELLANGFVKVGTWDTILADSA